MNKSLIVAGLMAVFAVSSFAQGASAPAAAGQTEWEKNHPRRDQVNDRLANQNKRIKDEVKEGDMSKAKAARLHKKDRQIRQEERAMAAQNGGHITKAEQKVLDQQENKVSKEIGK
jgi:TolA-binding protein